ncbi:hypothetical protein [Streptomonospora litoralis]|uniref:Uncharacterized protein n=1 Tax=Streptomonospora litoralis TaxID=2498135 RepID=A0A4P6Q8M1_9ACTN|nr:hypothetical protein [Streptomonospora litoralis]QBI56830.1 hypothetical protein EKD16_25450 [Streptomonospora litoralis]
MDEMTVRDLIATLQAAAEEAGAGLDAPVRLAQSPSWPFEYSVGRVGVAEIDPAPSTGSEPGVAEDEEPPGVVYIGEGAQLGHLPGVASEALDW